MTGSLDGSWQSYLTILVIALVAHESWRWLGAFLGRNVEQDDAVFIWVRYVSTAIVAALVMRLVLFPAGGLASVVLGIRVASVAVGAGIFIATRGNLAAGIATTCLTMVGLVWAWG